MHASSDPSSGYHYDTSNPDSAKCLYLGYGRVNAFEALKNTPPPVGGGCPYLFAWEGGGFVMDNNLLPASEFMGPDPEVFTDPYRMMQSPTVEPEGYRLQIRGLEEDRSYLDKVGLLRVDHGEEVGIGVAPDGRLVRYRMAIPARSVSDGEGGWRDVEVVHPRKLWEDRIVALGGELEAIADSLEVRLLWTAEHDIDLAALLVPSVAPVDTLELGLLAADHSGSGSRLPELAAADSLHAELLPGEVLDLLFEGGPAAPPGRIRDFIFTTVGYYVDQGGPEPAPGLRGEEAPGAVPVRSGPNPFTMGTGTRIVFELPVASPVSLVIYDVQGRRVRRLVEGILPAGPHRLWWDGTGARGRPLAPGIYFSVLEIGGERETRKLAILP